MLWGPIYFASTSQAEKEFLGFKSTKEEYPVVRTAGSPVWKLNTTKNILLSCCKDGLWKADQSTHLEGLCKSGSTSWFIPRNYEKTAQVQKGSSILSDNVLFHTEIVWHDRHKSRKGQIPVTNMGPVWWDAWETGTRTYWTQASFSLLLSPTCCRTCLQAAGTSSAAIDEIFPFFFFFFNWKTHCFNWIFILMKTKSTDRKCFSSSFTFHRLNKLPENWQIVKEGTSELKT